MHIYGKNLHRDHIPLKILDSSRTYLVEGAIVKLRFIKVKNLSLFEWILYVIFRIPITTSRYYWLPYKHIMDKLSNYGVLGPASRFPYSNQWFEIKQNNEIYKQGLNKFTFRNKKRKKQQLSLFPTDELLTLTRKSVIKMLDNHLFESI